MQIQFRSHYLKEPTQSSSSIHATTTVTCGLITYVLSQIKVVVLRRGSRDKRYYKVIMTRLSEKLVLDVLYIKQLVIVIKWHVC